MMKSKFVLKNILICLIVLFTITGLFLISNVFLNNKITKNSKSTVFAADLTISTLAGLKSFASEVNNGNTYAGKTIVLANDINCNNESIVIGGTYYKFGVFADNFPEHKFCGIFDGCNHTLSNIKIATTSNYTGCYYDDTEMGPRSRRQYSYALFPILGSGARIKNLKVDNISGPSESRLVECSGLVGVVFESDSNNVSVSNCIVSNSTLTNGFSGGSISFDDSVVSVHSEHCLASNCSVNNISGSLSNVSDSLLIKSDGTYSFSNDISSQSSLNTSYWHVPPTTEYNNGRPMLKSFITFDTINITRNNSSYGSVNKSSIQLPSGGSYSHQINNNTLTIYGNAIVATPNSGYVFDGWSVNLSQKSITANFKLQTYWVNINIYSPSNVEDYVTAKMTIVYSYGNKTYREMTNEPNPRYEVTAGTTITISNIQIIMENPDRYYIAEIKDGAGKTYNTASMTYSVTTSDSQTINIYVKLKGYDVVFE